jgi:hypothetical protein
MPTYKNSDLYDGEIQKSLNTLKRCREVWISKEKGFNRSSLFMYADPEFYFYSFIIDRAEIGSVELTKKILKRLLERYEIQSEWSTAAPFDFIAIDNSQNRIGFRFKELYKDDNIIKYKKAKNVKEIGIIFLNNESIDPALYFNSRNGLLTPYNVKDIFEMFFSENEFSTFKKKIEDYLVKCRDVMGYTSIPYLSPMNLAILKSTKASELKTSQGNLPRYSIIEPQKQKNKQYLNEYIIDDENLKTITARFVEQELYKALVGNADFAKSFLTAEWLYEVLKRKEHFDYTVIISGYMKSIEQLLYQIALLFITENGENGFQITLDGNKWEEAKNNGVKMYPYKRNKRYNRIDFIKSNIKYMNFELGSLNHFYKEHPAIFDVSNYETIVDMLFCFREECRNGYFHKHNLDKWEIVEKIRSNALCLYWMLLGGCKIGSGDFHSLGIDEADSFDLLCAGIRKFSKNKLNFVFEYEDTSINVVFDMLKNSMSFSKDGKEHYEGLWFIAVQDFSMETYELLDKGVEESQRILLTRENLPQKIWGIDRCGGSHQLL